MATRSLSSVMMDPGGLALQAPMDPGGMAIPQPGPIDPGGMALPQPPQQAAMPQAPAWQNPAAASAPGAIANAPRIVGNVLYEHGNTRELQPHELAAGQGYVEDFWRQFGGNNGNVWGSGHANDPYANPAIGFPAGRGPAFGEGPPGNPNWTPGADGIPVLTPSPDQNHAMGSAMGGSYGQFSSGPHRGGTMMGNAVGGAMGGPMMGRYGSAVGGAFGAPFGAFGGRQGGGAGGIAGRMRNRTLADVTNAPGASGGTDTSYGDPTLLR